MKKMLLEIDTVEQDMIGKALLGYYISKDEEYDKARLITDIVELKKVRRSILAMYKKVIDMEE
ncbi:MAG: hypothetical protein ACTSPB_00275 [Candidatus Thorarchaeota archaeon]